jgi:stearoyl-CoA desaturase (delta-9 desaturase)
MTSKLGTDKQRFNWHAAIFLFLFHVGALGIFFVTFSWKAVAITALLWWVSGSLGIGMGFHRLLTHRGFKTPKIVEYFLTLCGVLTLEGGVINWVVTHRVHHMFTDRDGDPHSPRDGVWWSHMGWILRGTSQQHSEEVMRRYAPDLMRDKVHVWLSRYYYIPQIVLALGLLALGGWPMVVWAIFFRIVFGMHATWLVNSATHLWGSRRFDTSDTSTNSWWVAVLTFGEGWHNNHHAFPRAARHGLRWYEIDMNWYGIWVLRQMGLATDIKLIDASGQTVGKNSEEDQALSIAA